MQDKDYSIPYVARDEDGEGETFRYIACGHCDRDLKTYHPCGDEGALCCTGCGGLIDEEGLAKAEAKLQDRPGPVAMAIYPGIFAHTGKIEVDGFDWDDDDGCVG